MKRFLTYLSSILGLSVILNTIMYYINELTFNSEFDLVPDFKYYKISLLVSIIVVAVIILIEKKLKKKSVH